MPAPNTPPTIEWVVETGAPAMVAMLIQIAAANSAASIRNMNVSALSIAAGSMMPFLIVPTTSPLAMNAPAASNTAAMASAPIMVSAPDPTAAPTLLATSLAPMFIAMYMPMTPATTMTKRWLWLGTSVAT